MCVCVCMCADISKVQDDEVGDGTTSVVVLACELLKASPSRHDTTRLGHITT